VATAYRAGFLRDTATDVIQVTTNAAGATYQGGFLRAPTGELVVTTTPSSPSYRGGFLRDANGALVVNNGGAGTIVGGWLRDTAGAIIVGTGAATQSGGFGRDASGRLVVAGLSTFAPTDLGASLLAWWKADSLALANAAPVTSWADSSGNARTLTQATAANQPVFSAAQINGLPAVTFDGTNDYLATGAFASPTSGASVFAVQKLTAANQYRTVLSHAAAATWVSPFARVLLRVTDDASGDRWQWIVEDAGVAGNAIVSSAATTATWQIVEGHYDQANQDIVVAGATAATQARTGALTSSTQPVFVGADTSLADNFSGQITEIVYCSSLNATQRGQVRSYLQSRTAL
jgi:hypothetical protein